MAYLDSNFDGIDAVLMKNSSTMHNSK